MFAWLKALRYAVQGSPRRLKTATGRVRLGVENLEERVVLSVTSHCCLVRPHVLVQALYYGSDWSTDPRYRQQAGYLDGFLNNVVNSSYMDMLGKAGYGICRGTAVGGAYISPAL